MKKTLYKDKNRKELAGVIAGLYDYFNLYENYGWKLENVRLVVIFLAIITNLPFLTAYIILAILLPDKSELN
ncbi:PspC domain-containing protein [Streptococcus suis]|uniref:PspC domain-containing protein n=1 Tax=Streptococcus TaxID=1301 RepID=UPI0015530AC8|nr:PspC domain-containing protein [Streptococcus suis]NQG18964.1 PspC domain-containing protein [Streptococcus suis]NQL63073.1 PspC domain-containing protein [Streptococcus suis]NQP64839.1 PspC domain-containing protein [Streptococcus suis]UUM57491.1 PspC domain-containing protein [Streptococcus suis]